MKLLIGNGADINAVNNDNQSALINAILRGKSVFFKFLNKEIIVSLMIRTRKCCEAAY